MLRRYTRIDWMVITVAEGDKTRRAELEHEWTLPEIADAYIYKVMSRE